jgi:hypothetical protein
MNTNETKDGTNRRNFLGTIASGAAALGFTSLVPSLDAFGGVTTNHSSGYDDPEKMFKELHGKHRVVYDAPRPHSIMPFAWPRVFLLTNAATGTKEDDCSVVVVLRHDAIPYAFDHSVWAKYKLGEFFKVDDPETQKPATRNPFWQPKPGAYKIPGFGEVAIGINQLQDSGVKFCVCEAAMTVNSAIMGEQMKMDGAQIRKDWVNAMLPGIQPVPSGVWALGRAQENKCAYIFAG